MKLEEFLEKGWKRYSAITPDAAVVHELLSRRGEKIINDHVAFRTFALEGIGRLELGSIFESWGYLRRDDLDFPAKKLKATYWIHPDRGLPRIFISELLLDRCDAELQNWIRSFARTRGGGKPSPEIFFEPPWQPVSFEDYERFYPSSEYAAWTAAFGIQINHFTVFVNALRSFRGLAELNGFLQSEGIVLNASGGLIKGSSREGLEQSSTQARKIPWKFAGGATREIMSCYYEFAHRFPLGEGPKLFDGFIPESADKIFESTFEKKKR